MNLSQFFDHWHVSENPFKGEEARNDAVFARINFGDGAVGSAHSDFEKVLGDLESPSTAVVFGEKGSGKTAIRMQITDLIRRHNAERPGRGVWVIHYDDLNAVLDTLHERTGERNPSDSLRTVRLVDHMDAMLSRATTSIVDQLIDGPGPADSSPIPEDATRRLRRSGRPAIRDLRILQAAYDTAEQADRRAAELRRRLRVLPRWKRVALVALAWTGWIAGGALLYLALFHSDTDTQRLTLQIGAAVLGLAWLVIAVKVFLLERWTRARLGRKLHKQIRTIPRTERSLGEAAGSLPPEDQSALVLPLTDSDETRYAMLDRLRRVLTVLGYTGVIVLVDRVDEPTLISGDADRMRAVVWPMFNSKFLQQESFGLKMLLPTELRYALFKESSAFFQEARLDKQNLIERLSWTGSMLYDLCEARLRACRPSDAEPIALLDLFEEDVTGRDIVEALDQMHQPRDAFKLMYRCLSEHCSNVTAEQGRWRIPRLVLEQVRKQEAERVQQLYRGIRPA